MWIVLFSHLGKGANKNIRKKLGPDPNYPDTSHCPLENGSTSNKKNIYINIFGIF